MQYEIVAIRKVPNGAMISLRPEAWEETNTEHDYDFTGDYELPVALSEAALFRLGQKVKLVFEVVQ